MDRPPHGPFLVLPFPLILSDEFLLTATGMTDKAKELEEAAASIDAASLEVARRAVVTGCQELIHWLDLFYGKLERVEPSELHKFARALALTILGHLPTRPGTCPFCVQFGQSRSCQGCGYAATHGRCDSDQSSFSLFIEAFSELGRAIYLDTWGLNCRSDVAGFTLRIAFAPPAAWQGR